MVATDTHAGRLDAADYQLLRDATESDREDLILRLAGEAGLRPGEMAELTLEDISPHRRGDLIHYAAAVGSAGRARAAYLHPTLGDRIITHAETEDRAVDGPVFAVSTRRIQMLVSAVSSRVSRLNERPDLGDISARDLRRFYARTLLDDGLDPRIVKAIGGWRDIETVLDFAPEPSPQSVVDAFHSHSTTTESATVPQPKRSSRTDTSLPADAPQSMPVPSRYRPTRPDTTCERIERIGETIVALGAELEPVTTREGIESAACEALDGAYTGAWIADVQAGSQEIRASVGVGVGVDLESNRDLHDVVSATIESESPTDIQTSLGTTDEETTVITLPITHDGSTHGVLCVGTTREPSAIDTLERQLLADVARRVGQATTAVERQRLLYADTVVQLSLVVSDRNDFFVRLSTDTGCSLSLTGLVPGEGGSLLTFVWLEGAAAERVFDEATRSSGVSSARLIRSGDDGALFEFVLRSPSPLQILVDKSGSIIDLEVEHGRARITAEFVLDVDVRAVIESVGDAYPATELAAKREVERTVNTQDEFTDALADLLTPKQRAALQAAYHAGFFDWPRGSTAEELAASLDVTSPTFHNHLRRAQQKLLSTFFGAVDG